MAYNPQRHHRKSIRLKGYDYAQAGLYFITICCQNRECLFGNIINGEMILNDAGNIANECWLAIPNHFPNVVLHEFVIMPNHIHGIIELKTKSVGAENFPPHISMGVNDSNGVNDDSPYGHHQKPLGRWCVVIKLGLPNGCVKIPMFTMFGNAIIGNTSSEMKMNIIALQNTL